MEIIGNIKTNIDIKIPDYLRLLDKNGEIDDLPTLIIGFDLVNELYPNSIKAKNNHIKDNIYWTFNNRENRSKFDLNFELFIINCFENQIKDVKYVYVDLVHYKPRKLIKIIKKILKLNNPISLQFKDMIYIYEKNLIFGIDLNVCNFLDLERDKIINKVKEMSKVYLLYDDIIREFNINLARLNDKVKYLPILYKLKYG